MEEKERLEFDFPVFYHVVVKNNTRLPQYDAVNELLRDTFRNNTLPSNTFIDDSLCSNYVNGKKQIRSEIIRDLNASDISALASRIKKLGFQDIENIAKISKYVFSELLLLNSDTITDLVNSPKVKDNPAEYLAALFIYAIRKPVSNKITNKIRSSISDLRDNAVTASFAPSKPKSPSDSPSTSGKTTPNDSFAPFGKKTTISHYDTYLVYEKKEESQMLKEYALKEDWGSLKSVKVEIEKFFELPIGTHIRLSEILHNSADILDFFERYPEMLSHKRTIVMVDFGTDFSSKQMHRILDLFSEDPRFSATVQYGYRTVNTLSEDECIVRLLSVL